MPSAPVAITGLGAVSALGVGVDALRDAIDAGRDGLREMHRFDCTPFAPVHLFGAVPPDGPSEESRCEAWAARAALEAFEDAGVVAPPQRIAVVAGTTEGDESTMWGVAAAVAQAIGARGPRLTVSTACTSSANAIGLGRDLLARGEADVVVAGGAERLVPEMVAGFSQLGVLTSGRCSPFGEHIGTTLGEGAGFVVLERGSRNGDARGWLLGYGLSSDAWHETSPHPRGEGIERAMRGCLADAALDADAVQYVNAHATGTAANDPAEWSAIERVLGRVAVSGSKCFFGHAQGAAGALELIATIVCLERGRVPQTLRVGAGRARGPADPIAQDRPREMPVRAALCHSAAFGGANAILALAPEPLPSEEAHRRPVFVQGVGVVEDRSVALPLDLRGCDPSARLVVAAAHAALGDGGIRVRGALRDRAGIFGGARRVSFSSGGQWKSSVEVGGLARVSATAFARLVMHAPTGAASRLLALRGPTTTLADDGIAGLLTMVLAADRLAHANDAELLLGCGFEESEVMGEGDGAACVAFGVAASGVQVVGSALGPADEIEATAERALVQGGLDEAELRITVSASEAPSFESARAVVRAVSAVREGAASALVSGCSAHASAALVLTRVC